MSQNRPGVSRRRLVTAVIGVAVVVLLAFTLPTLVSLLGFGSDDRAAVYRNVSRLDVRNAAGDVDIVTVDGSEVRVHRNEGGSWADPNEQTDHGGGRLRIETHCPWLGFDCSMDYRIEVPHGTEVRVHSSAGGVSLAGRLAQVEAESSAGDVRAQQLTATELSATSSAGAVELVNVAAEQVTADSSAGNVELVITGEATEVVASSSAGDVSVTVPSGSGPYQVDAESSGGDVDVSVPTRPGDGPRISAESSAGDVTVEAQ